MSEPLNLRQLDDRARVLERHFAEGVQKDIDRLRARIEKGYASIAASGYPAGDERVVKAQAQVAELEDKLKSYERVEIAHYFEQAFLVVMRDALRWSSVGEGSRLRVLIPEVFDLTVSLDNLPEEAPF